jgi:hypothetical protein
MNRNILDLTLGLLNAGQVLEVSMAKPLADKKPDHSHRSGGGPNYPLPSYGGGYMGDPYGAYGGGSPAYNQVIQPNRSDNHIFAILQCVILLY